MSLRNSIEFLPAPLLACGAVQEQGLDINVVGVLQVFGMMVAGVGAAISLWCILTFVFLGKGTPAPFDPPRRLVVRGPHGIVRNPMYVGAGLALAGATLFYKSILLLSDAGLFGLIAQIFVLLYEEPTLRRTFGNDYDFYCEHIGRWWPKM